MAVTGEGRGYSVEPIRAALLASGDTGHGAYYDIATYMLMAEVRPPVDHPKQVEEAFTWADGLFRRGGRSYYSEALVSVLPIRDSVKDNRFLDPSVTPVMLSRQGSALRPEAAREFGNVDPGNTEHGELERTVGGLVVVAAVAAELLNGRFDDRYLRGAGVELNRTMFARFWDPNQFPATQPASHVG